MKILAYSSVSQTNRSFFFITGCDHKLTITAAVKLHAPSDKAFKSARTARKQWTICVHIRINRTTAAIGEQCGGVGSALWFVFRNALKIGAPSVRFAHFSTHFSWSSHRDTVCVISSCFCLVFVCSRWSVDAGERESEQTRSASCPPDLAVRFCRDCARQRAMSSLGNVRLPGGQHPPLQHHFIRCRTRRQQLHDAAI